MTIHTNLGIAKLSARRNARPTLIATFSRRFRASTYPHPAPSRQPTYGRYRPCSRFLAAHLREQPLLPRHFPESSLGPIATISDQTDAYVVLTLTGPKLRETLAKLIPIDLHPRSFQPGDAAQTLAHHISVILWRLEDVEGLPVFELAVPRSYSSSLCESLCQMGNVPA